MNALFKEIVNEIMRRIRLLGELGGLSAREPALVAATQALCAPISLEVGIDA
jgi:hypothetical protein